jgi:hypothetical protein
LPWRLDLLISAAAATATRPGCIEPDDAIAEVFESLIGDRRDRRMLRHPECERKRSRMHTQRDGKRTGRPSPGLLEEKSNLSRSVCAKITHGWKKTGLSLLCALTV